MVSSRPHTPRVSSSQAPRSGVGVSGDAMGRGAGAARLDDAAIRREFETLAARIRILQTRAAREAALLAR